MKFSVLKGLFAAILFTVALVSSVTTASALDRRVKIVNNTGYTMTHFYGSHRDAATWEEDILGNDVLLSGRSVVVNFDDGTGYCIFDFKAVFSDGDEVEVWGRNICELGTFTFNP